MDRRAIMASVLLIAGAAGIIPAIITGDWSFGARRKGLSRYGELGPYFTGKGFHYVDTYEGNDFHYVLDNQDGNICISLADGILVADVWMATEKRMTISRQLTTGRFSVVYKTSPNPEIATSQYPSWRIVSDGSIVNKAWLILNGDDESAKHYKGRFHEWALVKSEPTSSGEIDDYVMLQKTLSDSIGNQTFKMLEITKQRYTYFLNPKDRTFAAVKTDKLGMPLSAKVYQHMYHGSSGEEVLKVIQARQRGPNSL